MSSKRSIVLAAAVAVGAAALGVATTSGASTPSGGSPNPSDFSARVDNPWFPLKPGTTYIYRGLKDGEPSRDVMTVSKQTKKIGGVMCVVVHDLLYLRGRLHERTTDWYTQDKQGNVWYFGESTAELDKRGRVMSTEGTWQAGRNGAVAGIYFPAHPKVGQTGRQEFYKGHAEDHFQVLSVHTFVKVPYVTTRKGLLTKEWTPLEPDVLDHKVYVSGIGTVLEQSVRGPNERNALISVQRAP